MATLKVNGVRERVPDESDLGRRLPKGRVTIKDAARVHTARDGGPQIVFDGLLPDDVVELELEDGLRLWTRVDDVRRDLLPRAQRGQAAGDVIELPSELQIGPARRSLAGWGVRALKIIGIDIDEPITDFVTAHVEGQLQPGPGLYQCSREDPARLTPVSSLDRNGPILLFLHGTASSTAGSFAGLWTVQSGSLITTLFEQYGGR